MSIFSLFHREKKPGTPAYRKEVCQMLSGKRLKCTVKREKDGSDAVIARDGDIEFRDGFLTVFGNGTPIFRCFYKDLEAGELLSHDGCMMHGPDELHNNEDIMLLCYYLYWRRLD